MRPVCHQQMAQFSRAGDSIVVEQGAYPFGFPLPDQHQEMLCAAHLRKGVEARFEKPLKCFKPGSGGWAAHHFEQGAQPARPCQAIKFLPKLQHHFKLLLARNPVA